MKRKSISVVLVALLVLGGLPAQGHSQLVSASPRPGATLRSSPAFVKLGFNEDLISLGGASNVITVHNLKGKAIRTTETLVNASTVSISIPGKLREGRYLVRWRVVSADGHPISGRYSFTLQN